MLISKNPKSQPTKNINFKYEIKHNFILEIENLPQF
jgi:hypothetical protein